MGQLADLNKSSVDPSTYVKSSTTTYFPQQEGANEGLGILASSRALSRKKFIKCYSICKKIFKVLNLLNVLRSFRIR